MNYCINAFNYATGAEMTEYQRKLNRNKSNMENRRSWNDWSNGSSSISEVFDIEETIRATMASDYYYSEY